MKGLNREISAQMHAFLFISSKTFLSYSLVLKSKGLYIYLVDW